MANEIRSMGDGTSVVVCNYRGMEHMFRVDDEDLPEVSARRWKVLNNRHGHLYAASNAKNPAKRWGDTLLMHRLVAKPQPGEHVDHINHDTFDNRRSNLRAVHPRINSFNRKGPDRDTSTGVRNVHRTDSGRFHVAFSSKGRTFGFGVYDTIEEASRVANEAREQIRAMIEAEVAAA